MDILARESVCDLINILKTIIRPDDWYKVEDESKRASRETMDKHRREVESYNEGIDDLWLDDDGSMSSLSANSNNTKSNNSASSTATAASMVTFDQSWSHKTNKLVASSSSMVNKWTQKPAITAQKNPTNRNKSSSNNSINKKQVHSDFEKLREQLQRLQEKLDREIEELKVERRDFKDTILDLGKTLTSTQKQVSEQKADITNIRKVQSRLTNDDTEHDSSDARYKHSLRKNSPW